MWMCALALVAAAMADGVVINEVLADPEGSDAGAEWVELVNVGAEAVRIGGYRIEAATQPDRYSEVASIAVGEVLAAGGRRVVAIDGGSLGNATTGADAVRLVSPTGRVVDGVVYGVDAEAFREASADGVSRVAPAPGTGLALARSPDGLDGARWAWRLSPPTPDAANPSPPAPCVPGVVGVVVIDELLVDPSGADAGGEWIELRVAGPRAVDLTGWRVEAAVTPDRWDSGARFTFPEGTVVEAGDVVVIADPPGPGGGALVLEPGHTLGLGNGEDAVRLVDCEGRPVDAVVYGGSNPDGFVAPDGTPWPDQELAPEVETDACLARAAVGEDTGSGSGWVRSPRCTPGAPNDAPVPEEGSRSGIAEGAGCGAPGDRPGRPTTLGAALGLGVVVVRRRGRAGGAAPPASR